jgi:hypothetical protein
MGKNLLGLLGFNDSKMEITSFQLNSIQAVYRKISNPGKMKALK